MSQVTEQDVLVEYLITNGFDPKEAKMMVEMFDEKVIRECDNFKPNKFFVDDVDYPVEFYPPERGSAMCQKYCKSFVLIDWERQKVHCKVGRLRGLFRKMAEEKIAKSIS
jgi:hypothetical protein